MPAAYKTPRRSRLAPRSACFCLPVLTGLPTPALLSIIFTISFIRPPLGPRAVPIHENGRACQIARARWLSDRVAPPYMIRMEVHCGQKCNCRNLGLYGCVTSTPDIFPAFVSVYQCARVPFTLRTGLCNIRAFNETETITFRFRKPRTPLIVGVSPCGACAQPMRKDSSQTQFFVNPLFVVNTVYFFFPLLFFF